MAGSVRVGRGHALELVCVGSILFFSESTTTAGTWSFLLGSVQLMIRPLIRFDRRVHLQRSGRGSAETPADTSDGPAIRCLRALVRHLRPLRRKARHRLTERGTTDGSSCARSHATA